MIEDKILKEKAIKIKGKDYVLVSDRVLYFNEIYENGSIQSELISQPGDSMVIIKATVIPDVKNPDRKFVDYSQAIWGEGYINKTSALENACTSAVGRALGMMGIGVLESIASADEIQKAINYNQSKPDKLQEAINEAATKTIEEMKKEISEQIKTGKITAEKVKSIITEINPQAEGWDSHWLNNFQRGEVFKEIIKTIKGE